VDQDAGSQLTSLIDGRGQTESDSFEKGMGTKGEDKDDGCSLADCNLGLVDIIK